MSLTQKTFIFLSTLTFDRDRANIFRYQKQSLDVN